jgi:phage antirepressor YoqD-like protein
MNSLTISTQNGIQFFTVNATGEGGMSQSGLARACGLGESTIRYLIETLRSKSPSPILEPFAGKDLEDLTLRSEAEYHNVTILKDVFCAAVLTHYAQQGRVEAAKSLGAFAAIGIRVYIQKITGWKAPIEEIKPQLPTDYLSALKALVLAVEEKQALVLKVFESEQKVIELTPKAQEYDVICNSDKLLTMAQVAKILNVKNMGRTKLFEFLRDEGILQANNDPYQKFADEDGQFTIKVKTNPHNKEAYNVTLVTPKGLSFIKRRLEKKGYIIPSNLAA